MKCYIVRDLLPRYLDGLTGEEATKEVKAHLDTCESCHTIYEQMTADIPKELSPKKKRIDFFKKLNTRLRRQERAIVLAVCLAVIALAVFLKLYNVPIPYNQDYVSVSIQHRIAIPNPPYKDLWQDVNSLDFETAKAYLAGEYDDCNKRDFVELQYSGFNCSNVQKYGRAINRNGETVDVVYFSVSRELWDVLFSGDETQADRRGGWIIHGNLDDDIIYHAYTPRMTEIYYLPMGSTGWLKRLSDEDFDAEKEKGILVWSGVI